jgi:hypothetical protein
MRQRTERCLSLRSLLATRTRQSVVNMECVWMNEPTVNAKTFALLAADIFDAAGVLRRDGSISPRRLARPGPAGT